MKISESVKKYSANIPEGLKNNKIFEKIFQIERGFWESTGSESDIIYIDEHLFGYLWGLVLIIVRLGKRCYYELG